MSKKRKLSPSISRTPKENHEREEDDREEDNGEETLLKEIHKKNLELELKEKKITVY